MSKYFQIKVVDEQTGRGIPLVELSTNNGVKYYTDSAGIVAFYEPGLMDKDVGFYVKSHGYYLPDTKGQKDEPVEHDGPVFRTTPGGSATIRLRRVNIAERLYRITGQGIYRDSVLLGLDVPIREPLLNGWLTGQDSVQCIEYNGKLYWFWGDTHPTFNILDLNLRVTGATSLPPEKGGLDPNVGIELEYFMREDDKFTKEMVGPLPDGARIVWIFGLMTVPDETGKERLLTGYTTLESLTEPVARGILIFNDEKEQFELLTQFPDLHDWRRPGTAIKYEDGGKSYWLFDHKWPVVRVADDFQAIRDHTQYEAFTCLAHGERFNGKDTVLDLDADGRPIWSWKKNTPPVTQQQEKELIEHGMIRPEDARFQVKDVDTGNDITIHGSSVQYNEYRKCWVNIALEIFGSTSQLGEVWYMEAPSPTGPWKRAKKIVTHDRYSFYHVLQHKRFSQEGGRIIFFEGTYTAEFSRDKEFRTPWYDYNQIMYRLDLADPRLELHKLREDA